MTESITNEALFETFNLSVGKNASLRGHEWVDSVDGDEPDVGSYNWGSRLPRRSTGRVLKKEREVGPEGDADNEDVLGIPLSKLLDGSGLPSNVHWRTLDQLNHWVTIHVNEWRPAGVEDFTGRKAILMLHGVPTSGRWKAQIARRLARLGYVVFAVDMLGMGRSTKIWDYTIMENGDNVAWDWKSDVVWVEDIIGMIRGELRMSGVAFFADDWGAGILLRYLSAHPTSSIDFAVFTDPIWGDGYPVVEIATIGGLANLLKAGQFGEFDRVAPGLPQSIVGIEKYMVANRAKFNRWTESTLLDQYRDTRYQEGRSAQEMGVNYLNLAVLAARSGRLAPRQLQPRHAKLNPEGVDYASIEVPIHIVWGIDDQMMPPSQALTAPYRFPNARVFPHFVPDADHFAEIDNPDWVTQVYKSICLQEWGKGKTPVYIGDKGPLVYKGDEALLKVNLTRLYGAPVLYNPETLERLIKPIEADNAGEMRGFARAKLTTSSAARIKKTNDADLSWD